MIFFFFFEITTNKIPNIKLNACMMSVSSCSIRYNIQFFFPIFYMNQLHRGNCFHNTSAAPPINIIPIHLFKHKKT